MARNTRLSPAEQEVQEYLQRASAGLAGTNPEAQTLARSTGNPRAARAGERLIEQQQREQSRAQAEADREAVARRKDEERERRAQEVEQAKQRREEKERQLRAAQAAGVEIETDVESGERTIRRHEDGAPVFKAGKVGEPYRAEAKEQVPSDQSAVISGTAEQPPTVQADSKVGTPYSKGTWLQRWRDDRGNEIAEPVPEKVDAKTGQRYVEVPDAYGRTQREVVGEDPASQARLKLDAERDALDLRRNAIAQSRAQFDPRFKPVDEEYRSAKADWEKLEGNRWTRTDGGLWQRPTSTGGLAIATPEEVSSYQKRAGETEQRWKRAEAAWKALSPQAEKLEQAGREADLARLQLDRRRIALENGLPDDGSDGGASVFLAAAETGLPVPEVETARKLMPETAKGQVPSAESAVIRGAAEQPVPAKASAPSADEFMAAFAGLNGDLTAEAHESSGTTVLRNADGLTVARLDGRKGTPVVIVEPLGDELRQQVAFGRTGGVPVYLANSSKRQSVEEEAAWVANVFKTVAGGPQIGGTAELPGESGDSRSREEAWADAITQLGARPMEVLRRVKAGEISQQSAEAIMRGLYGTTLAVEDPADPLTFQKWLSQDRAASDWASANANDRDAIRERYVNEWWAANRQMPGVTWAMQDAARSIKEKRSAGQKAFDLVAKAADVTTEVGGSMAGLLAKYPEMGRLALFQNWDAKADAELNKMLWRTGRADKNFVRGIEGTRQRWFTDEGKGRLKSLDAATAALRSHIAAGEPYGDDERWKAGFRERLAAVGEAAYQLHALNLEDGWQVERGDFDPNQDKALGSALLAFVETADPKMFEQFTRRLMLDRGSRQMEHEMAGETEGKSKLAAAFTGGLYASNAEALIEIASDVLTAGAAKGITAAGKAAQVVAKGEEAIAAMGRVAKARRAIGRVLTEAADFGKATDTLASPAGRIGRAYNKGLDVAKVAAGSAVTEAGEEGVSGLADPDATPGSVVEQAGLGGVAGFFLGPLFSVTGEGLQARQDFKARQKQAGQFSEWYNRTLAKEPGFVPLAPKDAEAAVAMVDPAKHAELVEEHEAAMAELVAAREGQREQVPSDQSAVISETAEQPSTVQVDNKVDTPYSAAARWSEAVAKVGRTRDALVGSVLQVVEASQVAKGLPVAERAKFTGLVKAANGRGELLTGAELRAIGGLKTREGDPYFADVGGETLFTAEGRAEVQADQPLIGALIQTDESQALVEQRTESGEIGDRERQEDYEQDTKGSAGAEGIEEVPPAGEAAGQAGGSGQGATSGEPGAVNPAALDAAEYEAWRSSPEGAGAPDIPAVVAEAVAGRRPVSVSMAKAAGIGVPEGYVRRGAVLEEADSSITNPPSINQSVEESETGGPGGPRSREEEMASETPRPGNVARRAALPRARDHAVAAVKRAQAMFPKLKDRFVIDGSSEATGMGPAHMLKGKAVVNLADAAADLALIENDAEAAARMDAALWEEVIHIAQDEAARAGGRSMEATYAEIWREFTPEQQAAAAATYGSFDGMADWMRGAEAVRMLVQQRMDGQVTELTKAFHKGMPERLMQLLRDAVEFLRGVVVEGKVPERVQVAIEAIEEMLAEFRGEDERRTSNVESPMANGTAGDSRESGDSRSRGSSPLRVLGDALRDFAEANPEISAAKLRELEFAVEDLAEAFADLEPEELRARFDEAMAEWLASLKPEKVAKEPKQRRTIDNPARQQAFAALNSGDFPTLSKVFEAGKIAPRPNIVGLVLARRKAGKKLTEREMEAIRSISQWDDAVFQNHYENAGHGKVAREVVALLMAKQGEGIDPNVMAGMVEGGMDSPELWARIGSELSDLASGRRAKKSDLDPNRQWSDEEIAEREARDQGQEPKATAEEQREEFQAANTEENGSAFPVADFTPDMVGRTVTVDGEEMRISAVEMDSLGGEAEVVVLDDHLRFGRQVLEGGEVVYVEAQDELALFSSPQQSFDFGTSGDFGTKQQLGLDFGDTAKPARSGDLAKPEEQAAEARSEPDRADLSSSTPAPPTRSVSDLESLVEFTSAMRHGEVQASDIPTAWAWLKANKDRVHGELGKLTMKQLEPFQRMRRPDNKADAVRSALMDLITEFNPGNSYSFDPFGGNLVNKLIDAIDAKQGGWTDEYLAKTREAMAERKAAKDKAQADAAAAKEKALNNPETKEEWDRHTYIKGFRSLTEEDKKEILKLKKQSAITAAVMARGESLLTPDQLAAYDAIRGINRKAERERQEARESTVQGVKADTSSEIVETKHTKQGYDLFVVKLGDRVERSVYDSLNTAAKKLGGWYSSFKGQGAVPGFQFKTRVAAEQFQAIAKGESVDRTEQLEERELERKENAADRLRATAERMEGKADDSLNSDRKTNTVKRAREAAYAEAAARGEKALAETLQNLAEAIESGEATHLDGLRAKTQVETLESLAKRAKSNAERAEKLSYSEQEKRKDVAPTPDQMAHADYPYPYLDRSTLLRMVDEGGRTAGAKLLANRVAKIQLHDPRGTVDGGYLTEDSDVETVRDLAKRIRDRGKTKWEEIKWKFESYDRVRAMGLTDLASLRAALREFLQYRGKKQAENPIKKLERELVGMKLPGFFPTPQAVIDEMLSHAGDLEGKRVLEPSAGKGDIVEAAKAAGAEVDAIERQAILRSILEAKGANVIGHDFLTVTPAAEYDAVLMNPPFEEAQEVQHVRHAWDFLRPGGRLVSIMSNAVSFRQDSQYKGFREWVEANGGTIEPLPEGSFKSSFRPTGVATVMVALDKPQESSSRLFSSPAQPQPDLFGALAAPDAVEKFGAVKAGTMNALAAYRELTKKREKLGKLSAEDEEKLLRAETALGQKLAGFMEEAKDREPGARKAEAKGAAVEAGASETPRPRNVARESGTPEMMLPGEAEKGGQLRLFSSPGNQGVIDSAGVARILEGTYEPGHAEHASARAFEREVRRDKDLKAGLGGSVPEARPYHHVSLADAGSSRNGAAIVAELSGRALVFYRTRGDVGPGGMTRSNLPRAVHVNAAHPNPAATAGHELFHALTLGNPRLADLVGALIEDAIPVVLFEYPAREFEPKYGIDGAKEEVAANVFSSVVTDPSFWDAVGSPNGAAIAESLRKLPEPSYPQARLVPDWPRFVAATAKMFREPESRLFASPALHPDMKAAVEQALARMDPIYRHVYEAVAGGMDEAAVAKKYGLRAKAVENILNQVRSRIQSALKAAGKDGLKPAMRDGKFDGGRPDLALSTIPEVAAVDQVREESGLPGVRPWSEVMEAAERRLQVDYAGEYEKTLLAAKEQRQLSDEEVAIAKGIIARETIEGRIEKAEDRVKLAMLIHGYRDIGTETARSLAIRRDPHKKPAERAAMFIAEALFTPDEATRAELRKARKGQQQEILKRWMQRVDAIKAELLQQGIDIEASLKAYRQAESGRRKAEDESPRAAAVLDETIRKLTKREKLVIEMLRGGSKVSAVIAATGIPVAEIRKIHDDFWKAFHEGLRASAKRFMAAALGASPADIMAAVAEEFGYRDWADLDDTAPDYEKKQKQKADEKAAVEKVRKQAEKPKKKASPAVVSTEMEARWKELHEKWRDEPFATWRTLWQDEMKKLDPIWQGLGFGPSKPLSDTDWKALWQTEMDLRPDWMKRKLEEWAETEMGKAERRRQSELFPEPILETTGTFDLNDPEAMKEVINAFALARGNKLDALMEFWRASILSGPQTHIVNAGSNALNIVWELLPKRATEATINTLLGLVGQGEARSASFAEFGPMARQLRKAVQLGARNALRSWKLEARTFEAYARAEALQLDFTGVGAEYVPPALGGKLGKVMRSMSFRAMTAADEFFKSVFAQMEVAAQAHRMAAREEVLSGAAYESRLAKLMEPGSAAWIRAIDGAKRVTFQDELDGENPRLLRRLDQLAGLAKQGRNLPWIGRPLTFFLPFIDTPLNIFKQAVEISPLGAFVAITDGVRALRRKVFRGGLSKQAAEEEARLLYDRARFVQDLTNQTIAWTAVMALQGLVAPDEDDEEGLPVITGTVPYKTTKRGERDNAYAVMPPQTIRIGELQFNYSRVEPFATMLASSVDLLVAMTRAGGLKPGVATETMARFKDQVKDKTFLQGITALLNAIEDPDRWAERLGANIATGFVPNIIRQPLRESDTVVRDANPGAGDGFFTSVAKRVGFSVAPAAAPAKIDVWGRPVQSNRGGQIGGTAATDLMFRVLDPTNATWKAKVDPIDAWIFRYNLETAEPENRVAIQPIPNYLMVTPAGGGKAKKVALSAEDQAEANRRAGQAAREMLGTDWDGAALDAVRAERIKETIAQTQRAERARMKMRKVAEGLPELEKAE